MHFSLEQNHLTEYGQVLPSAELEIFRVISAFCDTVVSQNSEITRKIPSCAGDAGSKFGGIVSRYSQQPVCTWPYVHTSKT